jgi:hypothetical protein
MAFAVAFASGCQQPGDMIDELTQQATVEPYRLMTPAYYRESADHASIQVRFYESPRIFDLAKNDPQFTSIKALIDESRDAQVPMRLFYGDVTRPFISITGGQKPTIDEIRLNEQKFEITTDDAKVKKVLPGMAVMNGIFDYCAAQGCTTGTATIDYCIPFQYVVDGCYARAHKMRQIMNEDYNYEPQKVFSYEGPSGFLAVDAGDCCVFWWYHVAPLVTIKTATGVAEYVIDPSMFNEPVSIATWTSAQENLECSPMADFGYTEITPGKIYAPGGSTDNAYISTNWTLQAYADLITCE